MFKYKHYQQKGFVFWVVLLFVLIGGILVGTTKIILDAKRAELVAENSTAGLTTSNNEVVDQQIITPSTINQTITAGLHNGTGYVLGDADLIAGNIVSGVTIFGINGSAAVGYTYGDSIQSTVLTTATGAGTYDASNLADNVIKQGTTWGVSLGNTGTLSPNGGTAVVADLFNGKTSHLTADWSLDTGILNLACNTSTFDAVGNLVATTYDGAGNGTNRWCMTDSGDAATSDVLQGKVVWVDGLAVTGTITTNTLSALNDTVSAGYYAATTLSVVDTDLIAGNIVSGVTIFGINGSAAVGYTYGDSIQSTVLTTATGAGTYDASNLADNVIKQGTTWGVSLGNTGTLSPNGGTAAAADLFNAKTANLTADWTLDTGTLNLACNTATFDGAGNLVVTAYDGAGNGTNRWCMTDSGDTTAIDLLLGKIAWVDGVEVTGTISTNTLSSLNETVSAGYYTATTLSVVDTDLAVGNIISGKTIFGFAGTAVTGYTYGDSVQTTVLTTAIGAGTYNAANLSVGTVKAGTLFGVGLTGDYPSSTYPLNGDTGATDAAAGQIMSGYEAWTKVGALVTGTLATQTLSAANDTVSAGYYAATTLSAVDADLLAGNILSGKIIFGISGSVVAGYTYGDSIQSTVLTTAAGAGTYNAANLNVGTVKSGTAFGIGSTGDYPSATYTLASADATADLAASGNNISSSNGAVEWWQSDGTRQTATLDLPTLSNLCSSDTSNNSTGTLSVTAAYLGVGNTWCGTAGTLLANLFNGSGGFAGGSQANGGVDDYNNGDAAGRPADSYSKGWTACTNGADNYCGTGDPFADAKDNSTGLVWSKPCSGLGCSTSAKPADTSYSWDNTGDNNNSLTASVLCSQDLGTTHDAGWSLPHQKQLMQAYIDGSYGNLIATGVFTGFGFWSDTTRSTGTSGAWYVYLTDGVTSSKSKTTSPSYPYVLCVR